MIKLKNILVENKKTYQHSCVHKNDDYSNSIFNDASDMAYAIENSKPISIQIFLANTDIPNESKLGKLLEKYPDRFDFGQYENLMWMHDSKTDIHYFFV